MSSQCNIALSTVVMRRRPLVAAGLFDETLRRGQDFELWLRLALGGATIRYQRHVLADRRARASGLSRDAVTEIGRALNVLDRFGRAHALEGVARTALRIRMMALVDRLVEQAKQRLVEGNYAAARYHLSASRERGLKRRLALMALQVAPADPQRLSLAAAVALERFAGAGALTRRLASPTWADDRRAVTPYRAL